MNDHREIPPTLEAWLKRATCQLSAQSAARVRAEIAEHYESARDAEMGRGASVDDAAQRAVASLGDAKTANRGYRKVLLTSWEAKLLNSANCEARAVGSRRWLVWLLRAAPVVVLCWAVVTFAYGDARLARLLVVAGTAMAALLAMPTLPIRNHDAVRIFRWLRWALMAGAATFAIGSAAIAVVWPCLAYVASIEWTRVTLRRKIPAAAWPRHLYI